MVIRAIATGLLGATLYFVVELASSSSRGSISTRSSCAEASEPPANITVIDVAHGVATANLPDLVPLALGERIVAVDDMPVANDLAAGMVLAGRLANTGRYIDLTIGGLGERRVLVLLHPNPY